MSTILKTVEIKSLKKNNVFFFNDEEFVITHKRNENEERNIDFNIKAFNRTKNDTNDFTHDGLLVDIEVEDTFVNRNNIIERLEDGEIITLFNDEMCFDINHMEDFSGNMIFHVCKNGVGIKSVKSKNPIIKWFNSIVEKHDLELED